MQRIILLLLLISVSLLSAQSINNLQNETVMEFKNNLTSSLKKLSSELLMLLGKTPRSFVTDIENHKSYLENNKTLRYKNIDRSENSIEVMVYLYFNSGADWSKLLTNIDEVLNTKADYNFIVAWVKLSLLEDLAKMQQISSIRIVQPPDYRTGSVNSQGDAMHRTDIVRAEYSQGGAGIKIGVITDGVDSRASAQATGDLPPDGDGLTVLQNTHGGDEGTALLEIIHDLTPDADLYFHDSGFSTGDFIDAIDALITAGCNVICDDVGWILEPFFENGAIAQHVSGIINSRTDVLFTSAAGNAGESHYQDMFYPNSLLPSQHDFSQGQGGPYYIYLDMPQGSSLRTVMQWNDPFGGSGNDYDLYLVHTSSGATVSGSVNVQDGDDNPLEFFMYTADAIYNGEFVVIVNKYSGDPKLLEIYLYPVGVTIVQDYMSPVDAIFGHATVPGVIASGAVHWFDPNTIASYSSQGPSTMFDYSGGRDILTYTLQTPLLAGAAGVWITGAGGFGQFYQGSWWFYGTSASAPHLAGVAAQLWAEKTPANTTAYSVTYAMTSALGTQWNSIDGYGNADSYDTFTSTIPSPNYVHLHTPNVSSWDDSDLTVNAIIAPGYTAQLWDAQSAIEVWYVDDNGSWLDETEAYTVTADNALEIYNQFTDPPPEGDAYLYVEFNNGIVGRTLTATHRFVDPVDVPTYTIVAGDYNEDSDIVTWTVMVTDTGNINQAGLLHDGVIYSETVIENNLSIYTFTINNVPYNRDLGDWLLFLMYDEDDFTYNISQKVVFPPESAPISPQNVLINVISGEIQISWDPVPDCTYNVYSSLQPYANPSTWTTEVTGLVNPNWADTFGDTKKFYFVKAIK